MPRPNYFKCAYCYTFFVDRGLCAQHEKKCDANPINKQCASCRFRELKVSKTGIHEYKCQKKHICKKDISCKDWWAAKAVDLIERSNKKEFI